MDYFEHEQVEEKLYNKKVSSFLLKYVMKYKKYVIISLILIIIITGVSLIVPYISKVFLDRYVIKTGFIAYPEKIIEQRLFTIEKSAFIYKKIVKSVLLENKTYFFLQSDLRYFSKNELSILKDNEIFLKDSFVLIESKKNSSIEFNKLIEDLILEGKAIKYNNKYLVYETYYKKLNINELLILRHYDIYLIMEIVIFILLAFTIQFVVTYYQTIILQKLSQYSMRDLRTDLYSRMLTYEVSYYDKNPI
ncbi:MAG: hypothetical protein ACK4YF_06635, partial [Exilispira sp.]